MTNVVFYEGLVVDVITNESHPDYSTDGFNIGMIKIRFLREKANLPDEKLYTAHPADFNIMELPLIGEVVLVQKILGRFFYTKKISLSKTVNHASLYGHNEYENSKLIPPESSLPSVPDEFEFSRSKEKFKAIDLIKPLRPFAGDMILQGRFGNSIRFGSSLIENNNEKLNANLILRVGQDIEAEKSVNSAFGLVLEDINKDASSLWMVQDQIIPLTPAWSNGIQKIRASNTEYNSKGSQIVLNSDQIIINSKKNPIYLFSSKDISLSALNDFTVNVDNNINIQAENDAQYTSGNSTFILGYKDVSITGNRFVNVFGDEAVNINGNKVFIGYSGASQPMVGGISLSSFLAELINTLLTRAPLAMSTMGPAFISAPVAPLGVLRAKLALPPEGGHPFNSQDNYVAIVNPTNP